MKTTFSLGLAVIIGSLQSTYATDNQDAAAHDIDYAYAEPSTITQTNQDTYNQAAYDLLPRKKCREKNAYVPNAAFDVLPTESLPQTVSAYNTYNPTEIAYITDAEEDVVPTVTSSPTIEVSAHDTYDSIDNYAPNIESPSASAYSTPSLEMPYVEEISTSNVMPSFGHSCLISMLGGISLLAIL